MSDLVDGRFEPGTPEATEWQAIRARVDEEARRRHAVNRVSADQAPTGLDARALRADAEQLAAEVGEHLDLVATLTASGWLLFPDTSEHQGAFNLQWCKDAGFKIHAYKATEGRTYVDGQAARTAAQIRSLGLIGMVYGFVFWSAEYDSTPALWNDQGRFFAQHAPADFAHAIDVEMLCTGKSTDVARVVAGYRSVYPNHPLMIYTNRSLYVSRSKGTPSTPSTLGLLEWHAGIGDGYYTSATGALPAEWGGISQLNNSLTGFPADVVWQYTDHGAVAGQLVDGNAFKGTVDDFRRVFITGGVSDDMAQADVDAIRAALAAQDKALRADLPGLVQAAVHSTPVGRLANADKSPVTVGQILAGEYAEHPITPAQAQTLVAAALTEQVQPMTAAVVDGIRSDFPEVNVDYTRMGQVVAARIDEHLGSLRVTSDAPASPQA